MVKKKIADFSNGTAVQFCPKNKYWVHPYQRKISDKNGKTRIQKVKGYCRSYYDHYHKMAMEEKIPLEHLYYALTIYGEAGGENIASKRAIAWVIRNRFKKKKGRASYQKIVVNPTQFNCWNKNDPNYKRLQNPGHYGPSDKRAWGECKRIIKEIYNAPEKNNPLPGVYNYFSGKADLKHNPWEKGSFDLPGISHFHFVKLGK